MIKDDGDGGHQSDDAERPLGPGDRRFLRGTRAFDGIGRQCAQVDVQEGPRQAEGLVFPLRVLSEGCLQPKAI